MVEVLPLIQWAGGKRTLYPEISKLVLEKYPDRKITRYIEPFLGAGGFSFSFLQEFDIREIFLSDINHDLISMYSVVRDDLSRSEMLETLTILVKSYNAIESQENRKSMYLELREDYNSGNLDEITKAAFLIFMNKIGFNGLYRVNRNGVYNVPFGATKIKTLRFDYGNIEKVGRLLQSLYITLTCNDYSLSQNLITNNCFVYLDPPYHPLSETASLTMYEKGGFTKKAQYDLRNYCQSVVEKGGNFIQSNSHTPFIDELYEDSMFEKVIVQNIRNLSANGTRRGLTDEYLIKNKT